MFHKKFIISGNICGARIRVARALQKPPITQYELSEKINHMGYKIAPSTISKIERNQRHIYDKELLIFSQALNVSMEWLCGKD